MATSYPAASRLARSAPSPSRAAAPPDIRPTGLKGAAPVAAALFLWEPVLKIHREGYPFIAIFVAINLLAFLLASWLGWLLLPITLWCVAFFRDPERKTPGDPGLIIGPADGKLLPISNVAPPAELGLGEAPRPRLSIFMNVFNVHVNRNPVSGHVVALSYRPGKFFNASFDKASTHNERMSIR